MAKSIKVTPPVHIDGARVVEWAWSDVPFGHLRSIDGKDVIAIYGLALCQYEGSSQIYRFSCNAQWETEMDDVYESVEDAKAQLPTQYQEAAVIWHASVDQ